MRMRSGSSIKLDVRDIAIRRTVYDITPVPAPRMMRADAWKQRPCVLQYRAFRDEVRYQGIDVPPGAHLEFVLPMPVSWSKKKRAAMYGAPHTQKPDLDNLVKALLDACYTDDSHIWKLSAEKRWGEIGWIAVTRP